MTAIDLRTTQARAADLRRRLVENVTFEQLTAIFNKAIELAIGGSWQATKLILGYVLGPPSQALSFAPGVSSVRPAPTKTPPPEPPSAPRTKGEPSQAATPAPAVSPEMEAVLSEPFRADELNEARRTSLLFGKNAVTKR